MINSLARAFRPFNWTGLSAFVAAIGTLLAGIGAAGMSVRRARSAEKPDQRPVTNAADR
jgi:hypothetical protein